MRLPLRPHPDTPCPEVTGIWAEVSRPAPDQMRFVYELEGAIEQIEFPQPQPKARADELWRATCFEAFLQAPGEPSYTEFNFAPSSQWAAYRFNAYREGMANLDSAELIDFSMQRTSTRLSIGALCAGLSAHACNVALTAVIKNASGAISYWALAHAPGSPDFHNPAGFTYELKAFA